MPELSEVHYADLAYRVRKAVMISMSMTLPKGQGVYTHDDYDDAMAALNELVRRARSSA